MKRTWVFAAGLLVLSGAIYVSSRLMAQPGAATAPQTKIALCNLSAVIKNYRKYQSFQTEIQADVKKYQDQAKKIQENIKTCTDAIANVATPADKKADYEKWVQQYKHQLDDLNIEAKTTLGKKSDDQMVILYKEVRDVAHRYAVSHGIELVLHYNDADETVSPADFWNPANVARKMQAGACMPLDYTPGMEISKELINILNGPAH